MFHHMPPIDRDQLAELIARDLTVREIALEVDRSPKTVCFWLKRYGLRTRRAMDRSTPRTEREVVRVCRKHGSTRFILEGRGYYRCCQCRQEHVVASRRNTRRRLVEEAGGRCTLCGYDRCVGALEFHHVVPSDKSFGLSWRGLTRSLAELREEAGKCVLLCSNCHVEVEAGVVRLPSPAGSIPLSSDPGAE